jgi:hypothetical protein
MHRRARALLLLTAAVTWAAAGSGGAQAGQPSAPVASVLDEHPAIQYAARPTRDRVSLLNRAIAEGSVRLPFQEQNGYLRGVLDALGIAPESQLLIFSRTGVQRAATSPQNPRAIFFNDSVVVGYIAGARVLEIAAHDPEQGVVFYTLDQTAADKPALTRRTQCLSCHVSSSTLDVPGLIVRSNFVTANGDTRPQFGSHSVDHRTRLLDRWGGWYVTGNYTRFPYNGVVHMGNVTVSHDPAADPANASNEMFIQWLNSKPETRGYVSSESDITPLMLFDHQTHVVNLLTRLNWESRVGGNVQPLVEELTDYLLFVGEVPPPAKLSPGAAFARWFASAGPRDRQGRSLRELDVHERLLRYPCSYMIYSDAFDNLPRDVKTAVYRRMWSILSGEDQRPKYAHLSAADRRAITEILRDTKTEITESFR